MLIRSSKTTLLIAIAAGFITVTMLAVFATHAAHAQSAVVPAGVVGDGTPGSCSEATLTAALATGGTITFNCGGPKTILILS